MIFHMMCSLIENLESEVPNFPPTQIYNESWLLRLILNWFSMNSINDHVLSFQKDANWYSEALLPTVFKARFKGDSLAESGTHVDGVIGNFMIGDKGKADFSLKLDVNQFVGLEAKLFSPLSKGITNAPYYDQAARSVACMAEAVRLANISASKIKKLGFYVLAPVSQINKGIFTPYLNNESIAKKVEDRVGMYNGDKDEWYDGWFSPFLKHIMIGEISWETLVQTITQRDLDFGLAIRGFYQRCITFNA